MVDREEIGIIIGCILLTVLAGVGGYFMYRPTPAPTKPTPVVVADKVHGEYLIQGQVTSTYLHETASETLYVHPKVPYTDVVFDGSRTVRFCGDVRKVFLIGRFYTYKVELSDTNEVNLCYPNWREIYGDSATSVRSCITENGLTHCGVVE